MKATVTFTVKVEKDQGVLSDHKEVVVNIDDRFTAPTLAKNLEGLIKKNATWHSPKQASRGHS